MKNCLIIIFSLLIFSSCKNQGINDKSKRNVNWAWWVDAKTGKGEWISTNGSTTVKDGWYTYFYFNGSVFSKGRLIDGKDVDTTYWFNLQGMPDCYQVIKADSIYFINDGYNKSYNIDGTILGKGFIKNHTYYGVWTQYYKNNNIKYAINYIKDSTWRLRYYENGQKQDSSFIFDTAFSICKEWYDNGQVEEENNFVNGLQDGIKTEYYKKEDQSSSSLKTISTWKKGIEDGLQLDYYGNGQLKDSSYVIEKTPRDIIKYWREDGSIELKLTLRNGIFVNRKEYNNNGMLVRDTTAL